MFSGKRRRRVQLATIAWAAITGSLAYAMPAGAAEGLVTVRVVDFRLYVSDSAGNDASLAIDKAGPGVMLIASNDRIQLGTANCRYRSQTDSNPNNDFEYGYDRFAVCREVYFNIVDVRLGDGNDVAAIDAPGGVVYGVGGPGDDYIKVVRGVGHLFGDNGPGEFFPPLSAGGDDRLTGGPLADDIWGGGGDDAIRGGEGKDRVDGGPGNDTIDGGRGDDEVVGGSGFDTLDGGPGVDTVRARDGERDDVRCGGDGVRDVIQVDAVDFLIECGLETRPVR